MTERTVDEALRIFSVKHAFAAATSRSTTAVEIAKKVNAGECTCDIKNSKGECCIGDVNTVVKERKNISSLAK